MVERRTHFVDASGATVSWPNDPLTCTHERTSGSPVADTYRPPRAKHDAGHLVIECAECGTILCADPIQADCVRCGRSEDEHALLDKRVAIPNGEPGSHPDPADYGDCPEYVPPKPCRCNLPRVPETLHAVRPARTGPARRRVNRRKRGSQR